MFSMERVYGSGVSGRSHEEVRRVPYYASSFMLGQSSHMLLPVKDAKVEKAGGYQSHSGTEACFSMNSVTKIKKRK